MASVIETLGKNVALNAIGTTYGYMALFTDAGTTEVTGGSYARQAITWGAANAGAKNISASCVFAGMPACEVTHAGIYTADTAGTRGALDDLPTARTVVAGDTLTITGFTITLT
jgi:hypothetical protein